MVTESRHSIFADHIAQRMQNRQKNVFICYRGMYGQGGMFAQMLYYTILCSKYTELIPFCAPLDNNFENFEKRSAREIENCSVFVAIFTDGFCEGASDRDDDQVFKEFVMLARKNWERGGNVHVLPIYAFSDSKDPATVAQKFKNWLCSPQNFEKAINFWITCYPGDGIDGDKVKSALESVCEKVGHCSNNIVIDQGSVITKKLEDAVMTIIDLYRRRPKINDGLVWIGTRLSDIEDVGDKSEDGRSLFAGAITLFGENDDTKNYRAMCDSKDAPGRRVDHNAIDSEQDQFIFDAATELARLEKGAKFYFYNQLAFYNVHSKDDKCLCDALQGRCVGVNSKALLEKLNNKSSFHRAYKDIGNGKGLLDTVEAVYAEIEYGKLCKKLKVEEDKGYKFIVQEPIASGGSGTYILTKENEQKLRNEQFAEGNSYLCSVYREDNVPVNIHAILFNDGVVFSPGSIQIMHTDYSTIDGTGEVRRLMYRGADFVEFSRLASLKDAPENKINKRHIARFKELCVELCDKIHQDGYVGVLGIDGMIYGDEVRLLEVNCRFQASTALIDRALKDKGGCPSLQKINLDAWNGAAAEEYRFLEDLRVGYSNYSYNYIGEDDHVSRVLAACAKAKDRYIAELDGFTEREIADRDYKDNAHLFRVVFKTNICRVNEDGAVDLDECISEPVKQFREKIESLGKLREGERADASCLLALKIALLTQGVNISPKAEEFLEKTGGLRPATNDAADIRFPESFASIVINAPLHNKFQEFSPFDIDADESGSLWLLYYGKTISKILLYNTDPLEKLPDGRPRKTRSGRFDYAEVAYLSTDRLRVHVTNACIYKKADGGTGNLSCKFCNIGRGREQEIDDESIREVVQAHWDARGENGLRHFLIGGQSPEQNEATIDKVCNIITIIREVTNLPGGRDTEIYAMILPCVKNEGGKVVVDEEGIRRIRKAGLTQISFNIEIFDEVCAKKYMPGKSTIPRKIYYDSLLAARQIWLKSTDKLRAKSVVQQVRAMIILGLEPRKSFMDGVEWLLKNGIQPIISIFRPLDNTVLRDCVAPSMIFVYKTFIELQKQIDRMKEERENEYYILGPECKCCQNNTLSLPWEIDISLGGES